MIRLLAVELRRLGSRRLVRVATLGLLAVVVLSAFSTWSSYKPMSEEQLVELRASFDYSAQDWAENGEEYIAQCVEDEANQREIEPGVDWGCDEMTAPRWEDWTGETADFASVAGQVLPDVAVAFLFYACAIGVSFVAAEFSSGAMGNWLTFEPRRGRVFASKGAAVGIGVLPAAAIASVLIVASTWVLFSLWDRVGPVDGELWQSLAVGVLRLTVLTAGFGVLGAALGFLVRNTAAVIGIVVGYMIAVEGILGGVLPQIQGGLVLTNVRAVAAGEASYTVETCTPAVGGQVCEWVEHTVSLTHGVVYLSVILVVVVTAAFVTFRRRDVA